MIEQVSSLLSSFDSLKVAFIAVAIVWFFYPRNKYRLPLPPGPFSWPLFGNALSVEKGAMDKTLSRWQKQYGDMFLFYLGTRRIIAICGAEKIKASLTETGDTLLERSTTDPFAREFSPGMKGIGFSNDDLWKETRRFTLNAMKDLGLSRDSLQDKVRQEAVILCKELQKDCGKPVFIQTIVKNAVSNVICSIVFGRRFGLEDKDFQAANEAISRLFHAVNNNIVMLFYWMKHIPFVYGSMGADHELVRRFVYGYIEERHKTFDPAHIRDMLDHFLLVKTGKSDFDRSQFDERHMYFIIRDLFFAGSETTANTMLWAVQYMVLHPEVQEKCREEIHRVFGKEDLPDMSWREHLPYVDATIHEIQRVGDIAPVSVLRSASRDIEFCGYTIPKDTEVLNFLTSSHRDPKTWPEPDKFRPERYLDENGLLVRHEGHMPFSLGRRNCVGENVAKAELFIFFTALMQRFRFKLAPGAPIPSPDGQVGVTRVPDPCSVIVSQV